MQNGWALKTWAIDIHYVNEIALWSWAVGRVFQVVVHGLLLIIYY